MAKIDVLHMNYSKWVKYHVKTKNCNFIFPSHMQFKRNCTYNKYLIKIKYLFKKKIRIKYLFRSREKYIVMSILFPY